MYVGCARDENEFQCAIELASRVFYRPSVGDNVGLQTKRLVILGAGIRREDTVVLVTELGDVIGTTFIAYRLFVDNIENIPGAFLSSICIAEEYRGQRLSEPLLDAAVQTARRHGAVFAVVIARRAVDYFYTQFGFWGLSQYNKLFVDRGEINVPETIGDIQLRQAVASDIDTIDCLYRTTYVTSYGHCVRSRSLWEYILEKLTALAVTITVRVEGGAVTAYAMHQANEIFELAYTREMDPRSFVLACAQNVDSPQISIDLWPSHPIVSDLSGSDISLSSRECQFGGHMVRILAPEFLAKRLTESISRTCRSLGCAPFSEHYEDMCITWDGSRVSLHMPNDPAASHASTAALMGVSTLTRKCRYRHVEITKAFNIPFADQI